MKPQPLLLVPYSEVQHDQPDDCLHYESVAVRGMEMNWTIPAHRHDGLHQFQILEQGQVRGTIDGQEFEAHAPALLMLAPGSIHGFVYTRDAVGQQITLPTSALSRLLCDTALVKRELGASFVIDAGPCSDEVAQLFSTVGCEFSGTSAGRVPALLGLAALIGVQFIRRHGEQFKPEKGRGIRDALAQRFLTLVERHYEEQHPLEFYANQLAVTPDQLSRTCRKVAGRSALHLLNDRRMLEARRLLAYTPMTIAQVASHLGYSDAAYFTRCFGRSTGHAPTDYRALVMRGVRY